MLTFRSTMIISQQLTQVRELCDETHHIKDVLHSTSRMRSAFLNDIVSLLERITLHTQYMREMALRLERGSMEITVEEAISQVEEFTGETQDAVIQMLGNQHETSGDFSYVEAKLCFLSTALNELQEVFIIVGMQDSIIKGNSADFDNELSRIKVRASDLLRFLN